MKSENLPAKQFDKTKISKVLYALVLILTAFVFSQCNETSSASEATENIVPISGGGSTGGGSTGGGSTGGGSTGGTAGGKSSGASNVAAKFADTGQTYNFSTVSGEDGEMNTLEKRSYHDNGTTISDNATGLTWERISNFPSTREAIMTHKEAVDQCNALSTGGHNDWTLPSIQQLLTLFDYQQKPSIDLNNFDYKRWSPPNGSGGKYDMTLGSMNHWTSTRSLENPANYLTVPFGGRWDTTKGASTSSRYYALCVRGGELAPSASTFTINKNGTVTDNSTKLTWKIYNSSFSNKKWSNALDECNTLADNGGDWRLPNVNELLSIIDFEKSSPVVVDTKQLFTDVGRSDEFWTSTLDPQNLSQSALAINFKYGALNVLSLKNGEAKARCVKGG